MQLVDRPDRSRYEAIVDGETVAFADYSIEGSVVVLPHTVTTPVRRGQGYAGRVVRFALDDIRASGRRVVPSCWYVARFIDEHPEYTDLVA
ncbi:MAG: N-acetyltransferase [Actinobacteria bacterium]|nr:N-acetyltransferase [Actinomycetota bacterium]